MHLTQAEIASARLRSPQMTEPFLDGVDTTQVSVSALKLRDELCPRVKR